MFPGRKRDDLVHGQDASLHECRDRGVAHRRASRGTLQGEHVRVHQGASASVEAVMAARRLGGERLHGLLFPIRHPSVLRTRALASSPS
jgi:hypothetical protein